MQIYPDPSASGAVFLPNLSGVTDDNGQHGVQNGGKREPQKIPPFRIVEFLGVVRGMTTRQRLPHLSEALWRDAETPGNSATPVPVRNSSSSRVAYAGNADFPQPFLRCRQGGLRERSRSGFLVCLATVA